jgi:NAD(P)-dependent dehydrogenase (short-subunit alcohol dehydrogenase family)
MAYFITGGTGFIGKFLIERLLKREQSIYVLIRQQSLDKFAALQNRFGADGERLIAIHGDLTKEKLGISDSDIKKIKGKVEHLYHLAAIYDLSASAESQQEINNQGTQHTLDFAEAIEAKCFDMVSSIAAAGLYRGVFREDMFEEAENLVNPYLQTKHESEGIVRENCKIPYRIYRPGMVVGHTKTGEIDKIDGPYYFFKLIQKFRNALPSWMPTVGIEGGYMNIVPVDFVADAIDHISHKPDLDGKCFHLTDHKPNKIGQVLNIFAEAGHAPKMVMRIDTKMFGFIPPYIRNMLSSLPPVRRIKGTVLKDLGIPESVLDFLQYPTKFDNREAQAALADSNIRVPKLTKYAPALWDYWERNLDPDLFRARTLKQRVKKKVIVITGASSGIGKATTLKLARTEAKLILVARDEEKLKETLEEVKTLGGEAYFYSCDVSDMKAAEDLVKQIITDHERVDILLNNAGRSIRRSVEHSQDRFHDYERTMQLNYFGALKLITGFLPYMQKNRHGHIINISSIGVLTNAPRFSAYVASKSALDAFTRCAAAEYSDTGIQFTTINMPLVKTPMIAPTKIYDYFPTLSPEEAGDLICKAIVERPKRVATRLGLSIQVLYHLFPKVTEIFFNFLFRMFSDSAAAKGDKSGLKQEEKGMTSEQVAISHLVRGIHL